MNLSIVIYALFSLFSISLGFIGRFSFFRPKNIVSYHRLSSNNIKVEEILKSFKECLIPTKIESNLITKPPLNNLIEQLGTKKKVLIVTNDKISHHYLKTLASELTNNGFKVHEVILPDGEAHKTMDSAEIVINKAIECKLDRKTGIMLALGGGVIGDLTGFAASIYQRGIDYIQLPTSLLAMVDASIGGKTAVNHAKGKNLIGTFYHPKAVLMDLATLSTLPDREYFSGLSEVVKYGLIEDQGYFEWLEMNADKIVNKDINTISNMIHISVNHKLNITQRDYKEVRGIREILNFGHTFAHAIEAGFGYGLWLHGEAVSLGIMMALTMSAHELQLPCDYITRTKNLLSKFKLPVSIQNEHLLQLIGTDAYNKIISKLTSDEFINIMKFDKKAKNGNLNFVLMKELGDIRVVDQFNETNLIRLVNEFVKPI